MFNIIINTETILLVFEKLCCGQIKDFIFFDLKLNFLNAKNDFIYVLPNMIHV